MTHQPLHFIFTPTSFFLDEVDKETLSSADLVWYEKFRKDEFQALYELGFEESKNWETPSFTYLHFLAETFVEILTGLPEIEVERENIVVPLDESTISRLLNAIPFTLGMEHVSEDWLSRIFSRLTEIFRREIVAYRGPVSNYLSGKRQDLRAAERVFFHIVENIDDEICPFAFLAAYATKNEKGKVRHVPLLNALKEFKGDRQKLLDLMRCLERVYGKCPVLDKIMDGGEIYHPLRLATSEAYDLLKSALDFEKEGIICRVPNWWKRRTNSKIQLSVKLKLPSDSLVGFNSIIEMQPTLTINGVELNKNEIRQLLQEAAGLAKFKGQWIELNKDRLQELLDKMDEYSGDISFLEALRLENEMDETPSTDDKDVIFTNEDWLAFIMQQLRRPEDIKKPDIPTTVNAQLRPYQIVGFAWLRQMAHFGFGACLADDMGLGKTLQVLTFLEDFRQNKSNAKVLLIVPASLLGNWEKETSRFTPEIKMHILHGRTKARLESEINEELPFMTVTTYAMAARLESLKQISWDAVILDEAQAIKNPDAKQTKSIKKIPTRIRIALTGTPIENNLANLWSLFEFLNKGLLGTASEFKTYSNKLATEPGNYQKLRRMLSPFILRRLKTDKSIIADLPEKMEQVDYVSLSKKQIVLYRRQVMELERSISRSEGMARKGLVVSTITKLKQICNHPDQFLGFGVYNPIDSGKFGLLREICETIYEKRERVLVFTQYKEITDYIADYLSDIFHRDGLILHGGTPVKKRSEMVEVFNGVDYIPFMVLSVRAAGVGLNLTAASHVIHFDRWWNPAVENQATDRAYRIGQSKNVMVHKLVAKGTIEERIDEIINRKKSLAESVISAGEQWITELNNDEIISMMRLQV